MKIAFQMNTCSVCLDTCDGDGDTTMTACPVSGGHAFHDACIRAWFAKDVRRRCPMLQRDVVRARARAIVSMVSNARALL